MVLMCGANWGTAESHNSQGSFFFPGVTLKCVGHQMLSDLCCIFLFPFSFILSFFIPFTFLYLYLLLPNFLSHCFQWHLFAQRPMQTDVVTKTLGSEISQIYVFASLSSHNCCLCQLWKVSEVPQFVISQSIKILTVILSGVGQCG
jgi:hypothetical protein